LKLFQCFISKLFQNNFISHTTTAEAKNPENMWCLLRL